ncbi:MAG TPA: DUF3326 domain-containing protein [Nitrospirae bacterium]|nr:DUF3326 domain-containing protein [Nitrospirota bacterium]
MTSTSVAHKSGSSSFLIDPAIQASFLCLWHSLTKCVISFIAGGCDTLITHPNVVNASDVNELPENGLYLDVFT